MSRQASTMLGDAEYEHIRKALSKSELSMYSFVKQAVLREADLILGTEKDRAVIQQMVELVSQRKRFIYQMGPYSDENHRDWLAGRFPQATKREVIEAVAAFRAAGGKT